MSLDAKHLAEMIVHGIAPVETPMHGATPVPSPVVKPKVDFCSVWPKARPILEMVSGIVMFIPGAGKTAGIVLQGLLNVGDQISTEVCKTPPVA